jgi:hypothetical protein
MAKLKEWAERGAAQRAHEIEAELMEIRRMFPEIGSRRRVESGGGGGTLLPGEGKRKRKRTRTPMTAAQKREVSRRMKAYWASRRKAKG